MYVLNEILVYTPGRKQDALDRLSWIHGLMAPHAGFREAIVAKYLGDATRLTIMRFWEDEAAWQAFRASPDGGYGRNRPENLYVNESVATPLTSTGEVAGSAQGNVLVKVQWQVEAEGWERFLAAQAEAASALPGLVWTRQLRGIRNEDVAIDVLRFRSRDDAEALLDSQTRAEAIAALSGIATPSRTELFEVVSDVSSG
jgi:heme-degrading monooxygenase HmoA